MHLSCSGGCPPTKRSTRAIIAGYPVEASSCHVLQDRPATAPASPGAASASEHFGSAFSRQGGEVPELSRPCDVVSGAKPGMPGALWEGSFQSVACRSSWLLQRRVWRLAGLQSRVRNQMFRPQSIAVMALCSPDVHRWLLLWAERL